MSYQHNPPEHLNIKHDLYDSANFSKLILSSGLLNDCEREIDAEMSTGKALVEDVFYAFFKYGVDLKDPATVDLEHQLNRNLLIALAASPEWDIVRSQTVNDTLNAATAASSTITSLIMKNQDVLSEMRKQLREMRETVDTIDDIKTQAKQLSDYYKNNKSQLTAEERQAIEDQIKIYLKNVKKHSKTKTKLNRNIKTMAGNLTYTNITKNVQDLLNFQNDIFGWGDEEGFLRPTNPKDALAIQKMIIEKPNIIKIAQLAGRFHQLALTKQRQRTYKIHEEIADIKESGEIAHMIPSETMNLVLPELENVFYQKIANQSLLTYELSGHEDRGEGPIVICIDVSGSMSGDRDMWAKAVAIALIRIAKSDNRDSMVIMFDWTVGKTFDFPSDDLDLKRLIHMASYFTSGGTCFNEPLEYAMNYILTKEKFKKADIIFISDGDGNLSEERRKLYITFKKETDSKLYTIIVGQEFEIIAHDLKSISDLFIPVETLTEDTAAELFEEM